MLEFEKVNSGVRALKIQITLYPVSCSPISAQMMLPCRVTPAQGLHLALPCADGLQSIPLSPLSISLSSPALQIYVPPWIHTVDFMWWRLHMELVSASTSGSWHQWSVTPLCLWSQPLTCPDSFHPLSHPLAKSTSHQMRETLPKTQPKARETTHMVLPCQHNTHLIREEMRLLRQDKPLVNVPNAFSFVFLEKVIPLLTDNKE